MVPILRKRRHSSPDCSAINRSEEFTFNKARQFAPFGRRTRLQRARCWRRYGTKAFDFLIKKVREYVFG